METTEKNLNNKIEIYYKELDLKMKDRNSWKWEAPEKRNKLWSINLKLDSQNWDQEKWLKERIHVYWKCDSTGQLPK